jgi:hypothetical protein
MNPISDIRFEVENDDGEVITHKLPSCWQICDRCRGAGTHDHPAFSNGFTQEDFDQDPDFRDEYMAGRYDVRCEVCDGAGKVLAPDEVAIAMNAEQAKLLELYHNQRAEIARDRRADERTMRMESGDYSY